VAIKHIRKKTINSDTLAQLLVSEIVIQKSLRHHSICDLLQVIDGASDIYLVLQFCSGGDLHTRISSGGRLDEQQSREIFRSLLSAVAYCHSKWVIHRGNIMRWLFNL
jgi:calcium-dependent protein kinase